MENIQKLIKSIPVNEWLINKDLKLSIKNFKNENPGYSVEINIINEYKGQIIITCG